MVDRADKKGRRGPLISFSTNIEELEYGFDSGNLKIWEQSLQSACWSEIMNWTSMVL